MSKICTNIEQSKKLIELGVDVNTADMFWLTTDKPRLHVLVEDLEKYSRWDCMPAWSLAALLKLIPKPLLGQHLESEYWECTTWEDFNVVKEVHGQDNPIDAAYELVVWLKENGKI